MPSSAIRSTPACKYLWLPAMLNGPVNSKAIIPAESLRFVPSPKQIAEKSVLHDDKSLAVMQPAWIKRYTEIFAA